MSEGAPQLHMPGTEIYQWAQFFVLVSQSLARIRQRRASEGRLAAADDEHAALLSESRADPAVRPMTDQERQGWISRIPADLRSQRDESFTVWTAPMTASMTGGWGVEASIWNTATGTATSTLLVRCRDDVDAIDLCRWLRDHHAPDDLARLQAVAVGAVRRPRPPELLVPPGAVPGPDRGTTPLVLSEEAWVAALRGQLRPRLADRIIVTDPAHPHHTAWRELHALANEEVWRVGADPDVLARLVRDVPTWRDNVRKPPTLAHWALTHARTAPTYEHVVRWLAPQGPGVPGARRPGEDQGAVDSARAAATAAAPATAASSRLRLDQVQDPQEALHWAAGLLADNPQHRLEAKLGLGHWGSEVDTALARKFPGLMQSAHAAAGRERRREARRGAPTTADAVAASAGVADDSEPTYDRELLLREVDRLDPGKTGDRIAAFAMFGNVSPEANLALAHKFGDDERFAQKMVDRYPGGIDEIEAAALRARADANDQRGAAHMTVPDDPGTPQREDQLARAVASGDHHTAAAQRSAATTAAHRQPASPAPGARRSR